jgi:hypothetical protein
LVANRDKNGAASGKLYLDEGFVDDSDEGCEDPDKTREHYEFLLSANSVKK